MFCRLRAARPSVADSSGGRERVGEPHQRCRCVRSNPSPPLVITHTAGGPAGFTGASAAPGGGGLQLRQGSETRPSPATRPPCRSLQQLELSDRQLASR
ncbi:hypothetical protein NQZ68_000916 [Dissostichus eleginoides]|nr:hypothetical protein NQZ68_000916 [Dissostichus eleginoides]